MAGKRTAYTKKADGNEALNTIRESVLNYNSPVFIRLPRYSSPVITDINEAIKIGEGKVICEGEDLKIISSGIFINNTIRACDLLKGKSLKQH